MQICNTWNLLSWEHGFNEPDSTNDGWIKPPNSAPCRDAAAGMELTVFLCVPTAMLHQWTGWPITGRHLFSSTDGRIPLPKFGSDAPVTSWSSLRESPSADSCCGPLPGSCGVSLCRTQHKSQGCTVHLVSKWLCGANPSQTCTSVNKCTIWQWKSTQIVAHSLNEGIF